MGVLNVINKYNDISLHIFSLVEMIGADTTLWEALSLFASSIGKDRCWIRREPSQGQAVDRYGDELPLLRVVYSFREWLVDFVELAVEGIESEDDAISLVSLRGQLDYLVNFNRFNDLDYYFDKDCEYFKDLRARIDKDNLKDEKIQDIIKDVVEEVIEYSTLIGDKKEMGKILAPCINRVMPIWVQLLVKIAVANNYHTVPPQRGNEYAPEEAGLVLFRGMVYCLLKINNYVALAS